MRRKRSGSARSRFHGDAVIAYLVVVGVMGVAANRPAVAAPICSSAALRGVIPEGTQVDTADQKDKFCVLTGRIGTRSAGLPDGMAHFRIMLPTTWNRYLVMLGVGGFAGSLTPSANEADIAYAESKSYVIAITDGGHENTPGAHYVEGNFGLDTQNRPALAARADYAWRATHQVATMARQLAERIYGNTVQHAFFDGCSNGGRQGLIEAARFPRDFDAIISGAPFYTLRLMLGDLKVQQANLATPAARLSPQDLAVADRFVMQACTVSNSVQDGILSKPQTCSPHWDRLVCSETRKEECLNAAQIAAITAFTSDTFDETHKLVYRGFLPGYWAQTRTAEAQFAIPGQPPPEQGKGWPTHTGPLEYQFDIQALRYLVMNDPSYEFVGKHWLNNGIISSDFIKIYDEATQDYNVGNPDKLRAFTRNGGKILLYHGFSDPAISPKSTIDLYDAISGDATRLFMIPGLGHCSGGAGPASFDTLTALERWVQSGNAPPQITTSNRGTVESYKE